VLENGDNRDTPQKEGNVANRRVTYTRRGPDWEIVQLCNAKAEWEPRTVAQVVDDIESGRHQYYVDRGGFRTDIDVQDTGMGKLLIADPSRHSDNNLENLLGFLHDKRRRHFPGTPERMDRNSALG
jgi:hypothetical protein